VDPLSLSLFPLSLSLLSRNNGAILFPFMVCGLVCLSFLQTKPHFACTSLTYHHHTPFLSLSLSLSIFSIYSNTKQLLLLFFVFIVVVVAVVAAVAVAVAVAAVP